MCWTFLISLLIDVLALHSHHRYRIVHEPQVTRIFLSRVNYFLLFSSGSAMIPPHFNSIVKALFCLISLTLLKVVKKSQSSSPSSLNLCLFVSTIRIRMRLKSVATAACVDREFVKLVAHIESLARRSLSSVELISVG